MPFKGFQRKTVRQIESVNKIKDNEGESLWCLGIVIKALWFEFLSGTYGIDEIILLDEVQKENDERSSDNQNDINYKSCNLRRYI